MTPQEPRGGEGLKPCPHCSGTNNLHVLGYKVWCGDCKAYGPVGWTHESAIAAWNRRPTAPSASGGEAVAWRFKGINDLRREWGYSDTDVSDVDAYDVVQPLFAHPARMPTRAEIEAAFKWAFARGRGSFLQDPDGEAEWQAYSKALFHTGETKGDARG